MRLDAAQAARREVLRRVKEEMPEEGVSRRAEDAPAPGVERLGRRDQRRRRVVRPAEDGNAERNMELDANGIPRILARGADHPFVLPREDAVARRVERDTPTALREQARRGGEARRVGQEKVKIAHRPETGLGLVAERENRPLQCDDADLFGREGRGGLEESPPQHLRSRSRRPALGGEERRHVCGERTGVGQCREERSHALDRRRERRELAP